MVGACAFSIHGLPGSVGLGPPAADSSITNNLQTMNTEFIPRTTLTMLVAAWRESEAEILRFDGVSLTTLANRLGLHKAILSTQPAEARRKFGRADRNQRRRARAEHCRGRNVAAQGLAFPIQLDRKGWKNYRLFMIPHRAPFWKLA